MNRVHVDLRSPDRETVDPRRNNLVAAFPENRYAQLRPFFEPVRLNLGETLYDPGDTPHFVHFPVTFTAAVVTVLHTGQCAQVAIAGCDGLVGVGAFLAGGPFSTSALVQSAGEGVRVDGALIREEFERGGAIAALLLRFTQAMLAQVAQTVVCTRYHKLEQQFCRWLLLSLDRLGGDELITTHELIAHLLGVRRESVTDIVRRLEERGVLATRRRHLQVIDRGALERSACECYEQVKFEYQRLSLRGYCGTAAQAETTP